MKKKNPNFRLSWTTKMPGPSWGIPASTCKTGAKLRKKQNTVCSKCYALAKGKPITWPAAQTMMQQNLDAYNEIQSKKWIKEASGEVGPYVWFRWFHSGDLQSGQMLSDICEVAKNTPNTNHWLPTREFAFVCTGYSKQKFKWPENLTVRLSHHTIDPKRMMKGKSGITTMSSVVSKDASCPSSKQHGQCGDCRHCWDKDIPLVSYLLH